MSKKLLDRLPDPDDVFAYDTVKMVRVLDRRLGLVYQIVTVLVLVYVIQNILIKKMYLEVEKSEGWNIVKVYDKQRSINHDIDWDLYDRITNPGEIGATFIPTRILVTKGQTQEGQYCESPLHECTTDAECEIGDRNLQEPRCQNGHCMRRQWCPAENAAAPETETHILDTSNVDLLFQSYVLYHKADVDVSTTDKTQKVRYPEKNANIYPLLDLLRMANIKPEELELNGAILNVNVIFECQLQDDTCVTKVEAINVDTKTGFNHVYNHVYFENGVRKRDTYRMYGVRVITFTTGLGSKVSLPMIVLQLSSGLAMLGAAATIADLYMTNVITEKKYYAEQKVIQTEDFYDDD